MNNSFTITLAIIACVFQIWGHIRYNREVGISPNLTSWTIWGWTSLIDTLNYSEMTGDWQKNLLAITCSVACLVTWIICLSKGKFKKPKPSDYLTLVICTISIIVWKNFDLVKEANLLLQLDNLISFLPIIIGVAITPSNEKAAPWMLWTASYVLGTLVVIVRFEQWNDLVYPVSCAVLHFIVGALALRKIRTTINETSTQHRLGIP